MRTPQNNFSKNLATPHRNNSAARLVIKTFRQNDWQFPFLSLYFDHFFLVSLIDRLGKPQKRRVNESTNEWKWEEKSRFFLPTLPNRFTLTWTERKFKTSSNTFTFRSLIRMQMRQHGSRWLVGFSHKSKLTTDGTGSNEQPATVLHWNSCYVMTLPCQILQLFKLFKFWIKF